MIRANTKMGTLNDILATREKMNFPHRINLTHTSNHSDMKEWCKNNCKGAWRANIGFAIYFQFEDSTDALMFSLKWGSV